MKLYLNDVLDYMSIGSIALVHVAPEDKTFVCEISSKERINEFYTYICTQTHPYLEVTQCNGLKFASAGLEIFCE